MAAYQTYFCDTTKSMITEEAHGELFFISFLSSDLVKRKTEEVI